MLMVPVHGVAHGKESAGDEREAEGGPGEARASEGNGDARIDGARDFLGGVALLVDDDIGALGRSASALSRNTWR